MPLIRSESQEPMPYIGSESPPADLPISSAAADAGLTMLVYRYTRQADIVNEQMGYGEQLVEELWAPLDPGPEPTLQTKERRSQRTKSGRQVLGEPDKGPAPAKPEFADDMGAGK
jgi:hypothetical protein